MQICFNKLTTVRDFFLMVGDYFTGSSFINEKAPLVILRLDVYASPGNSPVLARLPVSTICMHGNPRSKHDSRGLWKHFGYRSL
jgi:hypothetical protein